MRLYVDERSDALKKDFVMKVPLPSLTKDEQENVFANARGNIEKKIAKSLHKSA